MTYEYPWWGHLIGWLMALSSMLCIPAYFIYYYWITPKMPFLQKMREICRPDVDVEALRNKSGDVQATARFDGLQDWREFERKLLAEPVTVELLQRSIGAHSKVLAEHEGNVWDIFAACHHEYDPMYPPTTSEGRLKLLMRPTFHLPVVSSMTVPFKKSHRHIKAVVVTAEFEVLQVCCRKRQFSPRKPLYILMKFLGQSASTVPVTPIFPLVFCETLIFRELLRGAKELYVGIEYLNRSRLRIELHETGRWESSCLAYLDLKGSEVLTPFWDSPYREVEETLRLKLIPLGPFSMNEAPSMHLITRATVQPLYVDSSSRAKSMKVTSPVRLIHSLSNSRHRRQGRSASPVHRIESTLKARPPFVVRKVPTDIFSLSGTSLQGSGIKRSQSFQSLTHTCDACEPWGKKGRSRSMEVLPTLKRRDAIKKRAIRIHPTPPWANSGPYKSQVLHDRELCRICTLYEEYFGERYPGHRFRSGTTRILHEPHSPSSSSSSSYLTEVGPGRSHRSSGKPVWPDSSSNGSSCSSGHHY
ncbi:unnamed protein product [Darwinula stevensoni]|uniref:Spermatogenesis-associated protein 6 N-terminal domain-containing protein n=1 Tax=Darwinula stevensoni TaxID=69355 RepID=A0A7R9AE31_9CRUS|nr:unnamed protein product [Darwinula stevensoni]CAG0901579.1 unnamed protein product [Darwinula stevensoni]